MRVIQIINHIGPNYGGAERLATTLHLDLLEAGVDAHLIAVGACPTENIPQAESLGFPSVRDLRAWPRLWAAVKARAHAQTVLHAHLFPTTFHVAALHRFGGLRVPCAMTEHNTWNRRRSYRLTRAVDRSIYVGFDRIVAISDPARDALLSCYPDLGQKTQTITNGAVLPFTAPPVRDPARSEPCILSLARLAPQKNHATALRALAKISHLPWRYVIAGGGELDAELKALTQSLGLDRRVTFLGHVTDIKPLLEEADVFLIPSVWEGFGLAAVEAMNAALPVIASDVPGLREVVLSAGNPVVAPTDVDGFASALTDILQSPERRVALGQAGHTAAKAYDRAGMTQAYQALWSDLVADRRPE